MEKSPRESELIPPSEQQLGELAHWRGYRLEFCRWLSERQLIGRYENSWAFPVIDSSGTFRGVHYLADSKRKKWFYSDGVKALPFVIGDPTAKDLNVFESQWDAFAFLDRTDQYQNESVAVIATRSATNTRKLEPLIKDRLGVYAWPQNDEAGERWFQSIVKITNRCIMRVSIPASHKDLNDWTKSGATAQELNSASEAADPVIAPNSRIDLTADHKASGNGRKTQEHSLKSTELKLVDKLLLTLPPVITLGERWFVYENGIWTPRERDHYRPEALAVIDESERTTRLAGQVLLHIEGKHQAKESPFCGAYKFDGEDILVSVANGVLRLGRELTLEPASPGHYFTQRLAVAFEGQARCRAFSQALSENLPDPQDQILFGLFCASIFVPDCRWEAALCCFGEAGTGKSTLFEGIEAMLGKGPCQGLSLTQLCDHQSYNAPDLEYAMLNFSTELNALELASDRFKQLVSGERIPVRAIYGSPYYIKPTAKYAFLTNHLPRFKDGTGAELRRLRFLKFAHVPYEKDLALKKRVAAEGSGILNLIVKLVPALLTVPDMPHGDKGSQEARQRFRVANDPVGVFLQTECILEPQSCEAKNRLEARFKTFLEHHGLSDKIANILFKELYERFNVKSVRLRTQGGREQAISGIELKSVTESLL